MRQTVNGIGILLMMIAIPVMVICGLIDLNNDIDELKVIFDASTTTTELFKFLLRCCYEIGKDIFIAFITFALWAGGLRLFIKLYENEDEQIYNEKINNI